MPAHHGPGNDEAMNATGYIISIVLILLVVRQVRERRLDARSLLLPAVLVGLAASYFLRSIPVAGNDLALELGGVALGVLLGGLGGAFTHVRRGPDGVALARAGWVSAGLWVAAMGGRLAFAVAADHGFGPQIASLSRSWQITSASAWVAALVLMALADVGTRLVILYARGRRISQAPAPQPRVYAGA
jgi:hypothetical protein